ncbi:transcription-repair coupling factor [Bartonella sp. TP]|uniref:transcription-repair coupling factor n=1 Tax=Bartonella sp. TP TaxID=3057550 RepID=UPI0025B1D89A|nr:transcription-repair coupling factor [Bartonella sp. TP]WJW80055.1 transcription-repair coupling factor [Bartonella sp. TP]
MLEIKKYLTDGTKNFRIDSVQDGSAAFILAELAMQDKLKRPILYITRDNVELDNLAYNLKFTLPAATVLLFPAWDCLPYDRVSPSSAITAQRLASLAILCQGVNATTPLIVLTTASAVMQNLMPRASLANQLAPLVAGHECNMEQLIVKLQQGGYQRVDIVSDNGEFAVRGGLLDIFIAGYTNPVRLDFFGNQLESIRNFDKTSQKTINNEASILLYPMSEICLEPENIANFRSSYIKNFGVSRNSDPLYEAVSEQRRFSGMEHWLPLFYTETENLFSYMPGALIVLDHLVPEAIIEYYKLVNDYYEARHTQHTEQKTQDLPYNPLSPQALYLSEAEVSSLIAAGHQRIDFSSFRLEDELSAVPILHTNIGLGKNFIKERKTPNVNLFETVVDYIAAERSSGKKLLVTSWTKGSQEKLLESLYDHGLEKITPIEQMIEFKELQAGHIGATSLRVEHGFVYENKIILTEQDILGDRLIRQPARKRRQSDYIANANAIAPGDIVVHINHGIGRFIGLKTISALGVLHDCLELHYASEGKLFIPVENIELLSRYGGDSSNVVLDKLGGVAWQARKAKLKKQLLAMAGELIELAAQRAIKTAPIMLPQAGLYDEFVARFPYAETEDQLRTIAQVLEDLGSGKPMDRLICGDVGFGKTEICLRAAFVAAAAGYQVAVVVPTTLLARQHYKTFKARFQGMALEIAQASRLCGAKELKRVREDLANGKIDIVIGTHALLSDSINFAKLGLLVIDEEQHFGVKHKEKLKELKTDIHVLTLSATPIPRTMQFALIGIRDLSLISSPPRDRLAVRTFVSPFDSLAVRETLLREHYRGGQSFFVCPRIADLTHIAEFLTQYVPEVKFVIAHGQLPPSKLDDIMNAFYDGKYDILLSTSIVESGLDIPRANTIIVYRSDMFGLAALYQLRGRVGRAKQRAYALFTTKHGKLLTADVEKRLGILQSIEGLGGGFQLASHDMDMRGAGNLLGAEQSGHIKEVGFELYQQMLEDAVAQLHNQEKEIEEQWSPQINIAASILIEEAYVPDLKLRLNLYKRLSQLEGLDEINAFAAELVDRFGPMPLEVQNLLKLTHLKQLCKNLNVEKLDIGEKGMIIHFKNNFFYNGAALLRLLASLGAQAKLRQDQSIFFANNVEQAYKQLPFATKTMLRLAEL